MVSFQEILDFSKKSKQIQSSSSYEDNVADKDKFGQSMRTKMQGVSSNDKTQKQNILKGVKTKKS